MPEPFRGPHDAGGQDDPDDRADVDDLDDELTLEADGEVLARIRAELAEQRRGVDAEVDDDGTVGGPPALDPPAPDPPALDPDDGGAEPGAQSRSESPPRVDPAPPGGPRAPDLGALAPPPAAGSWQPPSRARQVDPVAPASPATTTAPGEGQGRRTPRWLVPALAVVGVLAVFAVLLSVLG